MLILVHPHARGEHTRCRSAAAAPFGSSPRAWGTQFGFPKHRLFFRFIPTRVGNTFSEYFASEMLAVHPHARGEHENFRVCREWNDGSSPRAWGTRPSGLAPAR